LILNKGAKDGVKAGMTGIVKTIMVERTHKSEWKNFKQEHFPKIKPILDKYFSQPKLNGRKPPGVKTSDCIPGGTKNHHLAG
jgi:hypothetical protein